MGTGVKDDFNLMFEKLRKDVRKDFPIQSLYDDPDFAHWDYVSCWVNLTENEIRAFADYVNWKFIKEYQINGLSEDFKREFADRL